MTFLMSLLYFENFHLLATTNAGGRLSRTLCVALLALLEFVFLFSFFYLSIYSIYIDLYLLIYIKCLHLTVIISYI